MSDLDELDRFLAGPARKELQDYMDRLGPKLLLHSKGSAVSSEFLREMHVDWGSIELVIVDTVEFRISAPLHQNDCTNAPPDRRARLSGRGGRAGGASHNRKKFRH